MNYYKTLGIYKNSTGSNVYNPLTKTAYSYGWWCYMKPIEGKLVFNSYSYSPSTDKHQKALLSLLTVQPDLFIEAPDGLTKLHSAIAHYRDKIRTLIKDIRKPKTKARKNEERREVIRAHLQTIQEIKKLIK